MDLLDPELATDLENRFSYHEPDLDAAMRFARLRNAAFYFAQLVLELAPAGRERSLAVTKIEEAVMWANAGIARTQPKAP